MTANEKSLDHTLNELGYDPLAALRHDNANAVPEGRSEFDDSLIVLERHGAELLLPYLESENTATLLGALHVFSEMRSNGSVLIGPALRYLGHSHPSARWYALDGLLLYLRRLSPKVLALGLCLANDRYATVRKKVIEYIAGIPIEKLEAAQAYLPSFVPPDPHRKGLNLLMQRGEPKALIDKMREEKGILRCYIGAAVLKAAKAGDFVTIGEEAASCDEMAFLRSKLHLMKKSVEWRSKIGCVRSSVFEICPETLKIKGDLGGYQIADEDLDQASYELDDSMNTRRLEQLDRLSKGQGESPVGGQM